MWQTKFGRDSALKLVDNLRGAEPEETRGEGDGKRISLKRFARKRTDKQLRINSNLRLRWNYGGNWRSARPKIKVGIKVELRWN